MAKLHFSPRTGALALAGSLLLAACSSTPLEQAPLTGAAANSAAAAPAARSAVAPVAAGTTPQAAAGPGGTARIVYFDYDSSLIRPEFQPTLDAHARYLASHRDRRLVVAGHTDERGGREYNLALGQQRAEAVSRAMQLLGAGAGQVETLSFGEEKPVEPAHDENAWSRNRRAELSYR